MKIYLTLKTTDFVEQQIWSKSQARFNFRLSNSRPLVQFDFTNRLEQAIIFHFYPNHAYRVIT